MRVQYCIIVVLNIVDNSKWIDIVSTKTKLCNTLTFIYEEKYCAKEFFTTL